MTTDQSVGERQKTEQHSSPWILRGGAAAVISGITGIVLSPLMSAAYHRTPDGDGTALAPWEPALLEVAAPLLRFSDPVAVYTVYGMAAITVFLGLLLGVLGYRAYRHSEQADAAIPRRERWGFRLALGGLLLSLLGNIGDYWIRQPELVDFLGFLIGTIGGLLVMAVGFALLGYDAWRNRTLSTVSAVLLVLWFPVAIAVMSTWLDNIPGGALLPLGLVGVTLGFDLMNRVR